MGFLDFIFPKYCVACKKIGDYICADCFTLLSFDTYGKCVICDKPSLDYLTHTGCRGKYSIDGVFSSLAYKGKIKKMLYAFKYKPYLSDLSSVLSNLMYESLLQHEAFMSVMQKSVGGIVAFVPIPLHADRFKKRGYNHAEILARNLSKKFDIPVVNMLERVKQTSAQYGLKREDRKENIKDAFMPIPNILISDYPNILLVDDIVTTGSTMQEAAKVFKRNGAKVVFGLTLAQD